MKDRRFKLSLLFFFLAPVAFAAQLVNINTASKEELKTLEGVGDSIAQSIIDNRPYASIQEVSRAAGIGEPGSSSYEKIKNFITVGGAVSTPTETSTTTAITTTTVSTPPPQQSAGAGPPPLTVRVSGDTELIAGAGSYFSATAYGTQGEPLSGARFLWNFGDGTTSEGARVFHTFAYPGRYVVSVTAGYNYSAGMERMVVETTDASVSLEARGDGSLTIRNRSSKELLVGLWALVDSGKSYVIPEGTLILAGEGVRFSSAVTGLAGSPAASLLYPNGVAAAAAGVSGDSPLRGERVTSSEFSSTPVARTVSPVAVEPAPTVPTERNVQAAAVATSGASGSSAFWLSLAALVGLLGGGVVGVRYLQTARTREETSLTAEEFEIE